MANYPHVRYGDGALLPAAALCIVYLTFPGSLCTLYLIPWSLPPVPCPLSRICRAVAHYLVPSPGLWEGPINKTPCSPCRHAPNRNLHLHLHLNLNLPSDLDTSLPREQSRQQQPRPRLSWQCPPQPASPARKQPTTDTRTCQREPHPHTITVQTKRRSRSHGSLSPRLGTTVTKSCSLDVGVSARRIVAATASLTTRYPILTPHSTFPSRIVRFAWQSEITLLDASGDGIRFPTVVSIASCLRTVLL